mgnify:CR=1 FL=1
MLEETGSPVPPEVVSAEQTSQEIAQPVPTAEELNRTVDSLQEKVSALVEQHSAINTSNNSEFDKAREDLRSEIDAALRAYATFADDQVAQGKGGEGFSPLKKVHDDNAAIIQPLRDMQHQVDSLTYNPFGIPRGSRTTSAPQQNEPVLTEAKEIGEHTSELQF